MLIGYFSVIGFYLFRGKTEGYLNFSTQGNTLYQMTILLTTSNFPDIMLPAQSRRQINMVTPLFHEMAHAVAYAPDDTVFNESFATAVERIGLQRWLQAAAPAAAADAGRAPGPSRTGRQAPRRGAPAVRRVLHPRCRSQRSARCPRTPPPRPAASASAACTARTSAPCTPPAAAAATVYPGEDPNGPNYVGRREVARRQAARAAAKPAAAGVKTLNPYSKMTYTNVPKAAVGTVSGMKKPAAAKPTGPKTLTWS